MSLNRGEPDLSFIQPDVNLKDVSRLETKKVIHLTNEFLLRIADISNSFMTKMESKIFELEKKIDALDTVLVLVETKLENVVAKNTVDILPPHSTTVIEEEQKVIAISESSPSIPNPEIPQNVSTPIVPILPAPTVTTAQEAAPAVMSEIPSPPATVEAKIEEGKIKISDHPAFSKYFKMLRLGIPELGVKQKMASEGFDAALLDTPNALIDAPLSKPAESEDGSESDSSFSSSSSD